VSGPEHGVTMILRNIWNP